MNTLSTKERLELAKELELWSTDFLDTRGRLPSKEEFARAMVNITANILNDPCRIS